MDPANPDSRIEFIKNGKEKEKLEQDLVGNGEDLVQLKKDQEQNKKDQTQQKKLQDTPRNYGYVRSTQGRFRRATRDTN